MRAVAGVVRHHVAHAYRTSQLLQIRAVGHKAAASAVGGKMGSSKMHMLLLGDTMLGRYVNDSFTWDPYRMHEAWGDVLPYIKRSFDPHKTITAANLECAVTDHPIENPKAFNFKLSPRNIQVLKTLGVDFVSLANNHVLDYQQQGLADSLVSLAAADIAHAGAGATATAAAAPAVVEKDGVRVAFVGYSDHYEEWAARPTTGGINYINPDRYDGEDVQRNLAAVRQQTGAQLLVVFIHWGPNWRWHPDKGIKNLGRAFIDAGADLVFGHSAHHVQGVQVYKGHAIIYGAGGFIDDYALDKHFHNDLGALWVATITRTHAPPAGPQETHSTAEPAGIQQTADTAAAAGGAERGSTAPAGAGTIGHAGEARITGLRVVPTHIRQIWRRNALDAAPPGHGNPPYLSQVDLAHGDDYTWVASKLEELCAEQGTQVEAMPDEGGLCIRLQPLKDASS